MANDKNNVAPRDLRRVNIGDEAEMTYWTRMFQCTRYELEAAVRKVGAMTKDIEKELKGQGS